MTGSNIQNCLSPGNQPILDQSMCDGRKHLPDGFAVFLPERSNIAPSVYDVLVELHETEYTVRDQMTSNGT
jgi:hypothetical protein